MEFDLSWLLIGVPLVFGLGWLASKLDSRQWKREQRDAPRAYFKGLNLLLNEQQDKAIDAFIEAVQADPDTSELHFALGNLFRRRGEYERAVRVHQHLLSRGDLPKSERDRAQYALAQDFFKAGLFDRAETAYEALKGTAFDHEAALALLSLYERSREWAKAAEVSEQLEAAGTGSFASRIANYWCELALEAQARQDVTEARRWLDQARARAPQSARAYVLLGQMLARQGDHARERRHVAVHAVDAVHDEHHTAARLRHRAKDLPEMTQVAMAEDVHLRPGEAAAVDDRGVVQRVRDDGIARAGQRREHAHVRHVAGAPDERGLRAEESHHAATGTSARGRRVRVDKTTRDVELCRFPHRITGKDLE